jgi:hypothetical protein
MLLPVLDNLRFFLEIKFKYGLVCVLDAVRINMGHDLRFHHRIFSSWRFLGVLKRRTAPLKMADSVNITLLWIIRESRKALLGTSPGTRVKLSDFVRRLVQGHILDICRGSPVP